MQLVIIGVQDKATAARVPGSENPLKHVVYVWDTFATKSPARDVFIVAHSAGGAGTFNLLRHRTSDVLKRLRAVAFTDATHFFLPTDPPAVQVLLLHLAPPCPSLDAADRWPYLCRHS